MKHVSSKEILEQTVKKFTDNIKKVCFKHLKIVNITRNHSGMRSVRKNLRTIKYQEMLKTRGNLEMSSRKPNMFFSILKFKKL